MKQGAGKENIEKARLLYLEGKKLKDIAAELGVPDGTVRRWKSVYGWESGALKKEKKPPKQKKSKEREKREEQIRQDIESVMQNDDLTDKQKLFCLYYADSLNATQSYMKAYGCSYTLANSEGWKNLVKPCIKKEIDRIKKERFQREMITQEDIIKRYAEIAFSDMNDYVDFGTGKIKIPTKDGKIIELEDSYVNLKNKSEVNGRIISEISKGRSGIKIKLEDRMKALEKLLELIGDDGNEEEQCVIQMIDAVPEGDDE